MKVTCSSRYRQHLRRQFNDSDTKAQDRHLISLALDNPQKMASTILPLGESPSSLPPSVLPLFARRLTSTSISS